MATDKLEPLFSKNNILLATRLLCAALAVTIAVLQAIMSKVIHTEIIMNYSIALGWFLGLLIIYDDIKKRKIWIATLILIPPILIIANCIRVGFDIAFSVFFLYNWVPALLAFVLAKLPIRHDYKTIILAALTCFVARCIYHYLDRIISFFPFAMDAIVCSITLTWLFHKYRCVNRWLAFVLFTTVYTSIAIFGDYLFYLRTLASSIVAILLATLISVSKIREKAKWISGLLVIVVMTVAVAFLDNPFYNYLYSTTEEGRLEASVISDNLQPVLRLTKPDGTNITAETMRGKKVYLYFWSRNCSQCHALMPMFSEMAESAKADTSRMYFAVYLPYKNDDFSQYEETLLQHDYAFQWAAADTSNTIKQDLRFNGVPHLTILDENGAVVYNGYPDKEEVQRFERKHHAGKD